MFTHDLLGNPVCPFAERWMLSFKQFTIRVHHFFRSDDDRAPHNHPWWFLTLVLKGSYLDDSTSGKDILRRGSIRYRSADHTHVVRTNGVWTLVITGKKKRPWGFLTRRKDGTIRFTKSNKYFLEKGLHPCD